MRKIVSLLLIAIMLFSLTSCDGMIDFMGKMGKNIMGTDTSSAYDAVESVTVESTEDATTRFSIETGSTSITFNDIEIPISNSSAESLSSVTNVLPSIGESTVDDIASALRNEASTQVLVTEMGKTPDSAVAEAAKGTATVMNAVLSTYKDKIDSAIEDSGSTNTVLSTVSDALTSLSNSLTEISEESATVTKGDVVTLQLIESFAGSVASCVDVENGTIKEGTEVTQLISSANTLATITSTLSPASKFDLDLNAIVSSIMNAATGESETQARTLVQSNKKAATGNVISKIESYDLTAYARAIRSVYSSLSAVAGNSGDGFATNVSTLSLHKGTYEAYVNMASAFQMSSEQISAFQMSSEQIRAFDSFTTFDGLFKYVVASVLSEADRYYQIFLEDNEIKGMLGEVGLSAEDLPKNIWEFIVKCVEYEGNEWITDSSIQGPYYFNVPAEYESLVETVVSAARNKKTTADKDLGNYVVNNILKNDENYGPTISSLETLNEMIEVVSLSSISDLIGGNDLHEYITKAVNWFKGTSN